MTNIPKRTKITFTTTLPNGLAEYELYTTELAEALANLQEAEERGEVTDIRVEE